ncbi:hypothetical protein [Streptomyces sp. NPDC046727]|uniref:hypothetical protein n=1 Tax=Streptomyces sp. NPDC046727 TaxID=3155373 RepID=UPI003400B222
MSPAPRWPRFPPSRDLRATSEAVAVAVARTALDEGIARTGAPADIGAAVRAARWEPVYPPIAAG